MGDIQIKSCPGTLSDACVSYSNSCLKSVFFGKKVNHILHFELPKTKECLVKEQDNTLFGDCIYKIEQIKNKLFLTLDESKATHYLKTSNVAFDTSFDILANEHLTMQIAAQVYSMNVSPNALIWFKDGQMAYITKKCDYISDGSRLKKLTVDSLIDSNVCISFEELATLIRLNLPAWRIEIEKFFSIVIFHYLFGNGAYRENLFSFIQSQLGDLILSPAYNLINTSLHQPLTSSPVEGLFTDDFISKESKQSGKIHKNDFVEFGKRIGVLEKRIYKILQPFLEFQPKVELLISNSFISNSMKRNYLLNYNTKLNYLTMQLSTIEQISIKAASPSNLIIPFNDL